MLRTAILLRCVWAGEAEDNIASSKEREKGRVVELAAIVSLKGMEGGQRWQHVRLVTEGECPHIVRVVIKNDEVVLAARMAQDQRGPNIIVQKTEWRRRNICRILERLTNMFS